MRQSAGTLATVLVFLILLPGLVSAEKVMHPKKYGVEIMFGGGYYAMEDVNNYVPEQNFLLYPGGDNDKINIGTQFGLGINYRQMDNFGWSLGYTRLAAGVPVALEEKQRLNAFYRDPSTNASLDESWSEQTISGSEWYFLPTWYWDWKNREIMFSVGPAIYHASLDRSIAIYRSVGSGANPAGSFENATGSALGMIISVGVEIPYKKSLFLTVKAGGRLANIGELTYEDDQGVEKTVMKNTGSNATLATDFSGGFVKVGFRAYFKPTSEWRSPRQ